MLARCWIVGEYVAAQEGCDGLHDVAIVQAATARNADMQGTRAAITFEPPPCLMDYSRDAR